MYIIIIYLYILKFERINSIQLLQMYLCKSKFSDIKYTQCLTFTFKRMKLLQSKSESECLIKRKSCIRFLASVLDVKRSLI